MGHQINLGRHLRYSLYQAKTAVGGGFAPVSSSQGSFFFSIFCFVGVLPTLSYSTLSLVLVNEQDELGMICPRQLIGLLLLSHSNPPPPPLLLLYESTVPLVEEGMGRGRGREVFLFFPLFPHFHTSRNVTLVLWIFFSSFLEWRER